MAFSSGFCGGDEPSGSEVKRIRFLLLAGLLRHKNDRSIGDDCQQKTGILRHKNVPSSALQTTLPITVGPS
jgi:hypothetical protein